ncbi:MAG TPA: GNAT family N-acetyltransferase [Chloroflexota bacterium]|nr:GNAT family N-acetyltransferase [Chloroflexota bacterium]
MTAPRITLRELTLDDWPDVHRWGSLPEACRYEAWGPNTPDETRAFVSAAVADGFKRPRVRYAFAVTLPDGPRVIGLGELRVRDVQTRLGDIGYVVHPDFWQRGIGTEVGRALLAFGFKELKLHRITATCDPRNVASGRILQKIGMTYEGRLRRDRLLRDGWRDSDLYAILEVEWSADSPAAAGAG